MSINKHNYLDYRNQRLASHSERNVLGEREVQTLLTILHSYHDNITFKDKMILDLGCGDQYVRQSFEYRGANYLGLDINICNFETDHFPLKDNTCDIAFSLALLEHLHDPGLFLSEIRRVLKPNGLVFLSTPDIKACKTSFWNDPTHIHPYTRVSLRTLLAMNGFLDVLVTPNYRCKPLSFYRDTNLNFFRARHLMPFLGTTRVPVPEFLKGHCTGLFAMARNAK